MMGRKIRLFHGAGRRQAVLASLALLSCSVVAINALRAADTPPSPPDSAQTVSAPPNSVQAAMLNEVDPSADALWASVGTEENAQGTVHRAPATDADWAKVVADADTLISGARHLQQPHLVVGADAHSRLADTDIAGTRTAEQIQADIQADPARFAQKAKALEAASLAARQAAHAHDAPALIEAGATIDAACEACHAAYWYPRHPPIPLPDDATFEQQALRP